MKPPPSTTRSIELLQQFVLPERFQKFEDVASKRTSSVTVVLDNVENYHNISAVLRTAEAFGLTTIHLIGKNFTFSRGITKGAERWLEIKSYHTPAEALAALTEQKFRPVILEPDKPVKQGEQPHSIPVYNLPFHERLALVFGNELTGVSEDFINASSLRAHIPMFGFVLSLNISVSTAITLFCSTISQVKGERAVELLTAEAQAKLMSEWLQGDLRNGESVLKEVAARDEHGESND